MAHMVQSASQRGLNAAVQTAKNTTSCNLGETFAMSAGISFSIQLVPRSFATIPVSGQARSAIFSSLLTARPWGPFRDPASFHSQGLTPQLS
jgi:hypothetical protein